MTQYLDIFETQRLIVISAYNRGLRSTNLESQPAPWLLNGLRLLEAGKALTTADIEKFNLAGGTAHPDPWFG